MPADPAEVTAAPNTLATVVSASTREEVFIRNMSGADVLLYVSGDAQPFDVLEAAPSGLARASLTGVMASLEITAKCPTAPLALWVTSIT